MVQNLTESLQRTPWILWVMVAAVALVGEAIERHGWLGRIATGLAAGAVVALLWPACWWLQWLVALAMTAALLVFLRPRHADAEADAAASVSSSAERRA